MKKLGIIYKITSPSGKFYIGKTIQPIEERLKQHSRDAKNIKRGTFFTKLDYAIK